MDRTLNQARALGRPAAEHVTDYQLAGTFVSRTMYEDAKASKRSGLRVLMVTPGDVDADAVERIRCANCNGVGTLALQTLIGGPYDDPPAANPENNVHAGVHNGKWYRMTLKTYSCPLCTKEIVL